MEENQKIEKIMYVSGTLTCEDTETGVRLREFYGQVGEVGKEFGYYPYIPHLYGDPKNNINNLRPSIVDKIDRKAVTSSSLLVAYIDLPSTGVGIEIEMAHHANVPVVLMYNTTAEENKKVSDLASGNPAVIMEIGFKDHHDALYLLANFMQKYTSSLKQDHQLPEILRR